MTGVTLETFTSHLLLSVAVSAAIGLLGLLRISLSRLLSSFILWATLRFARRGLAPGAQSYLEEWILSWEGDLRRESEEMKVGQLRQEIFLLARIGTLPLHVRALRNQAERQAATPARPRKHRGRYYGRSIAHGGRVHFDISADFRQLQVWFTDGQFVEILEDGETWDQRVDALISLRNLFTDRAPAEWHELVTKLVRNGVAVHHRPKVHSRRSAR